MDWIVKQVHELYGSGEEGGVGPFSIKSYFQYMVKDGTWRDHIMLWLIASMWGVRVSVLLGDSCAEIRIRHDLPWTEVEFGLLYNCNVRTGHYSGIKRDDETGVAAKKVKEGDNYSSTEDKRERYINSIFLKVWWWLVLIN